MRITSKIGTYLAAAFAFTALFNAGAVAGENKSEYDLSKVQGVERLDDKNALALLAKNGFVVERVFEKQIFSPYIGGGLPKYVTTDSAFRTYHVILEEAVKGLEKLNTGTVSAFSASAAKKSAEFLAGCKNDKAKESAKMLCAYFSLAAKLADESANADSIAAPVVDAELKNIKGGVFAKSAIFGVDFDFGRFKPRGIYAGDPEMEKYFRMMILYGCFGFRVKSESDTLAAAFMVQLFAKNPELGKMRSQVENCYRYFIGGPDDLSLEEYIKVFGEVYGADPDESKIIELLPKFQEALGKLRAPRINDQLLQPEEWKKFKEETKGLRLFGVKYIPDSELFQDLVDEKNPMPSGLYVASALGSPAAKRIIKSSMGGDLTAKLENSSAIFNKSIGDGNFGKTLGCIRTLFSAPPDGSPKFMNADAWKDREAFSALACWASMRHTWVLQSKDSTCYFCARPTNPGYVECRPEFFRKLSVLSKETAAKIREFTPNRGAIDLRPAAKEILEVVGILTDLIDRKREPTESDMQKFSQNQRFFEKFIGKDESIGGDRDKIIEKMNELKALCTKVIEGKSVTDKEKEMFLAVGDCGALERMDKLVTLLDNLAVMADKELAHRKFTKEENDLLNEYGETIAGLAFYESNSYEEPKDDMPIVADVYSNPLIGKVLEVGIGKAMPIYVIISDGDNQYLCKGAVMSYYEFPQPIENRLNDAEWRVKVNSGTAVLPDWTSTFINAVDNEMIFGKIKKGEVPENIDSVDRKKALDALCSAIKTVDDSYRKQELIKEFVRLADSERVRFLFDLVKDPYQPVGLEAAYGLVKLAGKDDFKVLFDLLTSGAPHVQDLSAFVIWSRPDIADDNMILEKMDSGSARYKALALAIYINANKAGVVAERAAKILAEGKETPVRYFAVIALAAAKDEKYSAHIFKGLDDSSWFIRVECAKYLGNAGAKVAVPKLKKILAEINNLDQYSTRSYTVNDTPLYKETAEFEKFWAYENLRAVYAPHGGGCEGPDQKSWILPLLDSLWLYRPFETALVQLGEKEFVAGSIASIAVDIKSKRDLAREMALERLPQFGSKKNVPMLIPLLDDNKRCGGETNGIEERICYYAAFCINKLLGSPFKPSDIEYCKNEEELKTFIQSLKKWWAEHKGEFEEKK